MKTKWIDSKDGSSIDVKVSRVQGLGLVTLYDTEAEGALILYGDEIDSVIEYLIEAKDLLNSELR